MTHRSLYWTLFLISVVSFIVCIIYIFKMNFKVAIISFLVTIVARIIAKIVKVDNDLKNRD